MSNSNFRNDFEADWGAFEDQEEVFVVEDDVDEIDSDFGDDDDDDSELDFDEPDFSGSFEDLSIGTDLSPVDVMGFPSAAAPTSRKSCPSKLERRIGQDVEVKATAATPRCSLPAPRRRRSSISATSKNSNNNYRLPRKSKSLDGDAKASVAASRSSSSSSSKSSEEQRQQRRMRRSKSELPDRPDRRERRKSVSCSAGHGESAVEQRRTRTSSGSSSKASRRSSSGEGRRTSRRQSSNNSRESSADGPVDRAQRVKELGAAYKAATMLEKSIVPQTEHLKKAILM